MGAPISVVLADDSALMRREIKKILESDPQIRVVAAARNGQDAVDLVRTHQPDVVTMDINMPVMDGITALQMIMMESPLPVVMLSSLTQQGALTTFECLELGAVDFIPKPSGTISVDIASQSQNIITKVKQAAGARVGTWGGPAKSERRTTRQKLEVQETAGEEATQVVAIGISTGGPKTLMRVIPQLPGNLPAAVVIVQHMPETFTGPLAKRIDAASELVVHESRAGDILKNGHCYLARGGRHILFARPNAARGILVRESDKPTDTLHTPSADVMMESLVDAIGERVVGVLMTGMGSDGAEAMVRIKAAGGSTIAEAESTCTVFGMPARAIAKGCVDHILPNDLIADKIVELVCERASRPVC